MAEPQLVREWINKADEDFDFAVSVIEESPYYSQICFHFHQAAEKYLKSYIIAYDLEFQKIHDLPVLLKMCMQKDPELQIILNDCKFLNRYYLDSRYPVHWPTSYDKGESHKDRLAAEHIRDAIKNTLKDSSHLDNRS
jgi:HEPN domain-containing protein